MAPTLGPDLILFESELEKELLKFMPKLFFNFNYSKKTGRLVIEVPEQLILKVERYIVPRIILTKNVVVKEQGKKSISRLFKFNWVRKKL